MFSILMLDSQTSYTAFKILKESFETIEKKLFFFQKSKKVKNHIIRLLAVRFSGQFITYCDR